MAIPRNLGNLASGADSNGVLGVTKGGTGAATLTANNVLLGNGTSAVQAVAPGTTGNVLTSNGTTWTSAAAPASNGGATVTNPMSSNVTLTASSNRYQVFTPNAQGLTITLPNATTLSTAGGPIFVLENTVPTIPIAVMDSSGTNIGWVVSDYDSHVYVTSTASATGSWRILTGNAAADGGVFLYDASYPLINASGAGNLIRSTGFALSKNIFVGVTAQNNVSFSAFTMNSTPTNRSILGGDSGDRQSQMENYLYSHCFVSSSLFFTIYQSTSPADIRVFATSVSANGTTTKGTELVISGANNATNPFCVALNSTQVLVYFMGTSSTNASAAVIDIAGTTCTAGTILGNDTNQVGQGLNSTSAIAVLSSTRAHFLNNNDQVLYSVSISGTNLTRDYTLSTPASKFGIVDAASNQSMIFYNNGAGSVIAVIATDTGSAVTLGTASSPLMPITNSIYVSRIARGVALVISAAASQSNYGEIPFCIVRNISGVPTVIGRGYLPGTIQGQKIMLGTDGVTAVPITSCSMRNSSPVVSYSYKKAAITGGV